jgi:hypothetical protein
MGCESRAGLVAGLPDQQGGALRTGGRASAACSCEAVRSPVRCCGAVSRRDPSPCLDPRCHLSPGPVATARRADVRGSASRVDGSRRVCRSRHWRGVTHVGRHARRTRVGPGGHSGARAAVRATGRPAGSARRHTRRGAGHRLLCKYLTKSIAATHTSDEEDLSSAREAHIDRHLIGSGDEE